MNQKNFIFAALFLPFMHPASAQTKDSTRVLNLSEVNVVATRAEKNNTETPRSITVFTAEQLKQSGYNSIADVLSDAGGIYITGTGQNPGSNESIFMRGANSNQTVILLDGIRISDASTVNNSADLAELTLDNVERIEIIRGAHSTLYGSGAVGGVVSISTKNGTRKGINVKAAATGGVFGKETSDNRFSGLLGYTFGNGIYADAGTEKIIVKGLDATTDTVTDPTVFKNRDRDNWNRFTYHGDAGYHGKKLKLDFTYRVTDMKTDLDNGAYIDDDNYKLDFKRKTVNGSFGWRFNDIFSTQLTGGYTDTKRHSVNDSSVVDDAGTSDHTFFENTYKGKSNMFDWNLNAHLKHADFIIGIADNFEDMSQKDFYHSTSFGLYETNTFLDTIQPATTGAAYLHGELRGSVFNKIVNERMANVLSRYSLSLGTRISNHSICGVQNAIDGSLSIQTNENSILYFSYSTGFNNPSLYQLYAPETYVPQDGGEATNMTRGNKDLKAESSNTYEIGFKQKLNDQFQYTVSFFHSIAKDLIEYVYLWNHEIGTDTLGNDFGRDDYRGDRYINIGKQTTTGIELNLQASLSPKLILAANATLVSGKVEYQSSASIASQTGGEQVQLYNNGAFLDGKTKESALVRRPSEANINLTYSPCKSLHLIPSLRYVTARNDIYYDGSLGPLGALAVNVVDAYTLAGLAVSWNVWKGINLNLRGENLLDEKYEEIYGFSTRGRSFYVILSYAY
ncbi:MAG: TonB-dependent receptor [Bacteroidota bacterium]